LANKNTMCKLNQGGGECSAGARRVLQRHVNLFKTILIVIPSEAKKHRAGFLHEFVDGFAGLSIFTLRAAGRNIGGRPDIDRGLYSSPLALNMLVQSPIVQEGELDGNSGNGCTSRSCRGNSGSPPTRQ